MTNTDTNRPARAKTLDAQIAFRASHTVKDRLDTVASVKGISTSSLALWLIIDGLDNLQREMIG